MERKVDLNKSSFEKIQYEQVIDTSFTQLIPTSSITETINNTPTVDEFFQYYNELFFEIPKTGDNSHETLITTSTEYIGYEPQNEEITALTEEITSLRQQLLDTRQQLADLADVTTS